MNNLISQYSKYLGLVIGTVYLIGFIIINSFLPNSFLNYGIVNAKYFSAGILYLALLLIPVIIIYWISKDYNFNLQLPSIPIHCITIPFTLTFFQFIVTQVSVIEHADRIYLKNGILIGLFYLGNYLFQKFFKKDISYLLSTILLVIVCIGILFFVKEIFYYSLWIIINTYIIGQGMVHYKKKDCEFNQVFFEITGFIVFIVFFGSSLYQNIKSSFGGGAPVNVTLSFKPEILTSGSFKDLLDYSTVCDSRKLQLYDHSNGYLLLKKDSTFYHIKDDYVVMIKK